MEKLSRDIPIKKSETALLYIDIQHYNSYPHSKQYQDEGLSPEEAREKYGYFFDNMETKVLPNLSKIQKSCRENGVEILYTVIESLTLDGRDRSLDYKISGFNIPADSKYGKVADEIKPSNDEMIFKKSSSSPFISTNLHYILGNLGIKYLVICGLLTDQCVSSTVRDACDLGYLVTLVTDTCTTYSEDRHKLSIEHIKGYCRQIETDTLLSELNR